MPDMPTNLVRQPTQPVVAEKPQEVASPPSDAAMKDFDARLDDLLGAPKK